MIIFVFNDSSRDNIFKILPEEEEDDNKKPTGDLGMRYNKVKESKNVSEKISNNLLNYGDTQEVTIF